MLPKAEAQAAAAPGAGSAGSALLKATLSKAALATVAESNSDDSRTGLIAAFREEGAAAGSSSSSTTGCAGSAAASAAAASSAAAAATTAAAAATPRGNLKLLALCPTAPPSMQRDVWCMADYEVKEKLYTGYASKGEHRGRWTGPGWGCGRQSGRLRAVCQRRPGVAAVSSTAAGEAGWQRCGVRDL
jgi:hypothetical protein